jgi:transposase-like protein
MGIGKGRNHDRELKLSVLERLAGGESVSALGRELGVRRKLIQQWRAAYAAGGAEALRGRGRPRKGERTVIPAPSTPVAGLAGPCELELARQRIAALERKIGQQTLELDFFAAALPLLEKADRAASVPSDAPASLASSAAERSSKAG